MSASGSVLKPPLTNELDSPPHWLLLLKEEERERFKFLIPCIFTELTEKQKLTTRKYFPLILPLPEKERSESLENTPTDLQSSAVEPETIYIYFHSLKLLGIEPSQIPDKYDNARLYNIVNLALKNLTHTQKVTLTSFHPIFIHTIMALQEIKLHPTETYLNCPPCTKQNITKVVHDNFSFMEKFGKKNLKMPSSFKTIRLTAYMLKRKSGYQLVIDQNEQVGRGTYSHAVKAFDCNTGRSIILKKPKLGSCITNARIIREVLNHREKEIMIQKLLYGGDLKDAIHPGIVSKLLARFFNDSMVPYYETLEERYLGNLEDVLFNTHKGSPYKSHFTLNQMIKGFKQLIQGLIVLKSLRILHGDIKSDNIYFKINEGGLNFYLGDFGGSDTEETVNIEDKNYLGTISAPISINPRDHEQMKIAAKKNDKEMWLRIHYAKDLTGIGLSMFELITNNPFEYDKGLFKDHNLNLSFATPTFIKNELRSQGFDHERLVELFTKMLHNEWEQRPSLEEVLHDLENIE